MDFLSFTLWCWIKHRPSKHIETWTNCQPFCRWYFQMGFLGWKSLKKFLVEMYSWVYICSIAQYWFMLWLVTIKLQQAIRVLHLEFGNEWRQSPPLSSVSGGNFVKNRGIFYWIQYKCSDFQGASVARFQHESQKGRKSAHRPSLDATLHYQNHCWQRSMMTRCYIELRLALHHIYHSLWTTAWL